MRSLTALTLGMLLALLPSTAAASDWLFNAEVGLIHHDNLPRARLAQDRFSDSLLETSISADYALPWRTPGVFSVNLWAGVDQYRSTDDLNQRRVGIGAEYQHKLGLGQHAPWWSVDTTLGYRGHANSIRDGGAWQLGVAMGRGWQNGVDLRGRIDYERSDGRGGATGLNPDRVFDLENWRASAELDYTSQGPWGLFAGMGFQRGDINTSTTVPGMIMGIWADDPTFGPGWRTYRVSARVVTFTFGAQIDLGPATQFLVAWERLDGRARSTGASYDSNIYRFRLQHGF